MMTDELEAYLPEFVLGTLPPSEQAAVLAFLESHPEAWALVEAAEAALAELGLSLPPVKPRAAARTRLLSAAEPRVRMETLVARVAQFLDLGLDAARRVLKLMDDAAAWVATPLPGISLCDLEGGPALATARVGLVRLVPGVTFPHHTHYGDEDTLVLQGAWRDSSGEIRQRGETEHLGPDTSHDLVALDGPDLIYLVALRGGISLPDLE